MNEHHDGARKPLETDAAILAHVSYASPAAWGLTPDEVLLGHALVAVGNQMSMRIHLLAWPDGVRAILPSAHPPGSASMDLAVVRTYRAAASGFIGPVEVGVAP